MYTLYGVRSTYNTSLQVPIRGLGNSVIDRVYNSRTPHIMSAKKTITKLSNNTTIQMRQNIKRESQPKSYQIHAQSFPSSNNPIVPVVKVKNPHMSAESLPTIIAD